MSTSTMAARTTEPQQVTRAKGTMKDGRRRSIVSIVTLTILGLMWCLPTLGLLVTSFRTRDDAATSGWWTALLNPFGQGWTLSNYSTVFTQADMGNAFINSLVVAIPATIIPIMFAAFASYAFTFMDFPGKDVLLIIIVAVLVVPIQVAFQPLLDLLGPRGLGISGQYIAVWLLHTGFGMPLAIYTAFNGAGVSQGTAVALSLLLLVTAVAVLLLVRGWRPGVGR